jgi:hypothetical protein
MPVTKKEIAKQFSTDLHNVIQQGSKQLFVVITPELKVLVSYNTVVGKYISPMWHLTTKKYSATTSAHIRFFAKYNANQVVYDDDL